MKKLTLAAISILITMFVTYTIFEPGIKKLKEERNIIALEYIKDKPNLTEKDINHLFTITETKNQYAYIQGIFIKMLLLIILLYLTGFLLDYCNTKLDKDIKRLEKEARETKSINPPSNT